MEFSWDFTDWLFLSCGLYWLVPVPVGPFPALGSPLAVLLGPGYFSIYHVSLKGLEGRGPAVIFPPFCTDWSAQTGYHSSNESYSWLQLPRQQKDSKTKRHFGSKKHLLASWTKKLGDMFLVTLPFNPGSFFSTCSYINLYMIVPRTCPQSQRHARHKLGHYNNCYVVVAGTVFPIAIILHTISHKNSWSHDSILQTRKLRLRSVQ
jgi:hypothetical protein